MAGFRDENRFLIYGAGTFGLYMYSIDTLITNKWILRFLTVWTKLPITLIPVYMSMDVRSVLFDEMDGLKRLAFLRKLIVFFGFCLKNVFFYCKRRSIEGLIDFWDNSFKEDFFPEKHLVRRLKERHVPTMYTSKYILNGLLLGFVLYPNPLSWLFFFLTSPRVVLFFLENLNRKENQRMNRKFIGASMALAGIAATIYAFPSYFSKTKDIKHPSGIIHSHRSPEFEIVVTFDLIVSLTCVSAALFDCILIVFLSHVRAKLVFLRETLADIIDELIIDAEGRLLGKRTNPKVGLSGYHLRGSDDQADFSSSYQDVYEERELKGEEYQRNTTNIETKLRIWIIHHQQTIEFFKELSKVYSSIATFELGYIVLYTAMTAVNVVQMKVSVVALSTLLVASSNVLSLFFWCKISDELMDIDVFGDSFSQAWFLLPKKIKSTFACIIMRSQKPLSLYGFSVVAINLATFFEILKIAYQFFAFMVQISGENS